MDKFLDGFVLPKLDQEDINHWNRSININEVETAIESPNKEKPRTWWIHCLKKSTNIPQTFPWNTKGRSTTKIILWSQYYICFKIQQGHNKKNENYRSISLMNIDANDFHEMLTNWIKQQITKTMYNEQVGLISGIHGWFNIWKSINVI
jgi:hypothetical protein